MTSRWLIRLLVADVVMEQSVGVNIASGDPMSGKCRDDPGGHPVRFAVTRYASHIVDYR
jgi:hypothetical protein